MFFHVLSYLACVGQGQHFKSNSLIFFMYYRNKRLFIFSFCVSSSCAGVCKYEGKGGMCSIRLSEPLLKLRPRKDLVEVLKIAHESAHKMYCASLPTPYTHSSIW